MLLLENKRVCGKIPPAFRSLMGSLTQHIDNLLETGVVTLTWSSTLYTPFITQVRSPSGQINRSATGILKLSATCLR